MKTWFAFFLIWFANVVQADTIVSPEDFQKLSQGKTLYFKSFGEAFGAEQYFINRKSLWKPAEGDCDYGYWYPQGQEICFAYEGWPDPICWMFLDRTGTYFARQTDDPEGFGEIELVKSDTVPLDCPGPRVGS